MKKLISMIVCLSVLLASFGITGVLADETGTSNVTEIFSWDADTSSSTSIFTVGSSGSKSIKLGEKGRADTDKSVYFERTDVDPRIDNTLGAFSYATGRDLVIEMSVFIDDSVSQIKFTNRGTSTGLAYSKTSGTLINNQWNKIKTIWHINDVNDVTKDTAEIYINGCKVSDVAAGTLKARLDNTADSNKSLRIAFSGDSGIKKEVRLDYLKLYINNAGNEIGLENFIPESSANYTIRSSDAKIAVNSQNVTVDSLPAILGASVRVYNDSKFAVQKSASDTVVNGNYIVVQTPNNIVLGYTFDKSISRTDCTFGQGVAGTTTASKDIAYTAQSVYGAKDINAAQFVQSTERENIYLQYTEISNVDTAKDLILEVSFVPVENVDSVSLGAILGSSASSTAKLNLNSATAINANKWNKLVLRIDFNNTKAYLYINGKLIQESTTQNLTYGTAFDGIRFSLKGVSTTNRKAYISQPKIYQNYAVNETFECETNMPSSYEVTQDKSVAEVKAEMAQYGLAVRIYENDEYNAEVSDTANVADGNVIVAENYCGVFQYATVYELKNSILINGSSAKVDDFTSIGFTASAKTDENAKIYVAQLRNSEIVKMCVSDAGKSVSVDFVPDLPVEGDIVKVFLMSENGFVPVCKNLVLPYSNELNVLIVGNSFSRDTMQYVHQMAEADGDKTINVGLLYKSGRNLTYHNDNKEADSSAAINYYYNDLDGRAVEAGTNLKNALTKQDWDCVVLQNYVSTANTDSLDDDEFWNNPGVELARYVHNAKPSAKIMLHSIWSFEQGYNYGTLNVDAATQSNVDSYILSKNKMLSANIEAAIPGMTVPVVPVGSAVAAARNTSMYSATFYEQGSRDMAALAAENYADNLATTSITGDDYVYGYGILSPEEKAAGKVKINRDGFHLSLAGRYLASSVWYELFTGKDIRSNTFKPGDATILCYNPYLSEYGFTNTEYIYGKWNALNDEQLAVLKDIAHSADKAAK